MERTSTDPLLGRVLDRRYLVGQRVARGGMASVYRATDRRLDREVALKIAHPHLAEDPTFAERFAGEARAAVRLTHPNVVTVYDQGEDDGWLFLAMEYVPGRTLRDVIRAAAPVPPGRVMTLMEPVLAALAHAHAHGTVHRDVKPENVLMADDGRVKVADFGLARAVTADTRHTTGGTLLGSVSYLAPELVAGEGADARADVYAAGVILFELLTGTKPHQGENPIAVAWKHVHEPVPAPSTRVSGIPAYVDALVARACAREVDVRSADARVLLHQVRQVRQALVQGVDDDPDLTADLTPGSGGWRRHDEGAGAADSDDSDDSPDAAGGAWGEDPGSEHTEIVLAGGAAAAGAAAATHASALNGASAAGPGLGPVIGLDDDPTSLAWEPLGAAAVSSTTVGPSSLPGGAPTRARTAPDVVPPVHPGGGRSDGPGEHVESDGPGVPGGPRGPGGRNGTGALPVQRAPGGPPARASGPASGHRSRRGPTLLALLLVLVVAIAAGGWYLGVARWTTTPGVIDLPRVAAAQKLAADGLGMRVVDRTYSETVASGAVVRTDPKPGSRVLDDGTVGVVLSLGPERHAVPDVVGRAEGAAQAALEKSSLVYGDAVRRWSEDVPSGQVVRTSPPVGTELKRDAPVDLVLSKGPRPIDVPGLVGGSAGDARATLREAGLRSSVTRVFSDTVAEGDVVAQTPDGGTLVRGDSVALEVSKGPDLVAVPHVNGVGVQDATNALEQAGFVVEVHRSALYVGLEYVVTSDPGEGSMAPRGATVTLTVV